MDIDILRIIDSLSQLMYKYKSILAVMSAARQQVGQYTVRVYWCAGSYDTGQYTHCAGRLTGRAGSILEGFADDTYLSNVSFYS